MRVRVLVLMVCAVGLWGCEPVEKKKSTDPTVLAEDIDEPQDLAVDSQNLYWTTSPRSIQFGGSGKKATLQSIPLAGGEVRTLVTDMLQASALTVDGTYVYWFEVASNGKAQLNRALLDGSQVRVLLVNMEDPPAPQTRLILFNGRLYWGGVFGLYSMDLAGGAPELLVRGRIKTGGSLDLFDVNLTGLYWVERSGVSNDLKRAPLSGAYEDAGTVVDAGLTDAGLTDAGLTDAGMNDAGMNDAGTSDAGKSDGGMDAGAADAGTIGYPPEAPGVIVLRRGGVLNTGPNAAILGLHAYWFQLGSLLGSSLVRAPITGGPADEVFDFSSNGAPDNLISDGKGLYFGDGSAAAKGIYKVTAATDGGPKRGYERIHPLDLLSGGIPQHLRLDDGNVYFFAGGANRARLQKIPR